MNFKAPILNSCGNYTALEASTNEVTVLEQRVGELAVD